MNNSRYESLASFESVPLIPVRHVVDQNNLSEGEVIEYLVLKGNYMYKNQLSRQTGVGI
jgi:hypothetical protein